MFDDNACAVVRHLNKQAREMSAASQDNAKWRWLRSLLWLIDRLHFSYHIACQDESSSYSVPGVNPYGYPALEGIDSEAAEQVFHVANRWQTVVSLARL